MRPLTLVTLIVLTSAGGEGAAPQAHRVPGAGSVNGRVIAGDTGLPLSGATVRLSGRQFMRSVPAGDEGDFEFGEVPPGNYLLTAVTAGYAMGAFGQRDATDVPRSFELRARETRSQADIQLTRLGRISGQIVDESRRPAAGVRIQAVRRPRTMKDGISEFFNGGVTDTSGTFSVTGLPAGSYFVIATRRPPAGTRSDHAQPPSMFELPSVTYYPGTDLPASAQAVRVELGSESTNISFALTSIRLARIGGVVVDSSGRPATDAVVVLNPASTDVPAASFSATFSEIDDEGGFSLTGVPPGVYSLDVRSKSVYEAVAREGGGIGIIRTSPEFAHLPVLVAGDDLENLVVRTDRGNTLSGRVVVEGPMPAQQLQSIQVSATHVANAAATSRWAMSGASSAQADGSFEIGKLLGLQIVRASGCRRAGA